MAWCGMVWHGMACLGALYHLDGLEYGSIYCCGTSISTFWAVAYKWRKQRSLLNFAISIEFVTFDEYWWL